MQRRKDTRKSASAEPNDTSTNDVAEAVAGGVDEIAQNDANQQLNVTVGYVL